MDVKGPLHRLFHILKEPPGAVDREFVFFMFFVFMVVLRSGRGLKSFLEGVASSSPSMGPWRATGTRFVTICMDLDTHVGASVSERETYL